jgi:uncharacterized protein YukE
VGVLTPSDVKRWDVNAIHAVFQTASGRVATLQRLGESLDQVHNGLAEWQGEAGEAFRADLGKARRDIEADGAESRQVATAVSRAEADVRACKAELDDIQHAADGYGWTITPDWRINVGDTGIGRDPISSAAEQQALQSELNACKVHAHSADHELAAAIRGAVGEVQLDSAGSPPGGAPPNPADPWYKPRSLQDMLLPTGEGDKDPARMPQSLDDLFSGGEPGDEQPLSVGLPVAPSAPRPRLNSEDVERAKALLRPILAGDGVPPDQIEAQLDQYVADTQKWLDAGMPNYVAPDPPRQPPPGFGEGFGDRWFATEQGIKDLIGQGGTGAPGVLESWGQMLKGTTEIAVNPGGALAGEVKNAIDSPSLAYYLGGKASDGAFALPTVLFGGEGAGLAEVGDLGAGAVYEGVEPLPHSPIGLDNPTNYHTWGPSAAQDLYSAFVHGEPTAELSSQLADMSTHYIGDNPDRVVLGKWDGKDGGYIGEARNHGGIFFDTGDPTWDAMTYGLGDSQGRSLTWQVNEQFLRDRMEEGVPRIEYVVPDGFDSVEQLADAQRRSFSALEINFLKENAEAYGYVQHGNVWVREEGISP